MAKLTLVTGGTGFLGAHLIHALLDKGERVRALRRADSRLDLLGPLAQSVEWVEGDILDIGALEDAMQGVDRIYHCAAVVSFSPRQRKRMYQINIEGTANVVNLALDMGVRRLLHVSSIAALGRKLSAPHINETAIWENNVLNSHYAISKFNAEREVWRGEEEGLSTVIVNPSVILGPGFWNEGSAQLFTRVWNGLRYYPAGATGFVDVNDVVTAMIELMDSDTRAERFILNGENLSYKSLFTKVAAALGKQAPTTKATPFLAALAWRAEWLRTTFSGREPLITRETARNSAHKFYYDSTKIQDHLPDLVFTPIDVTIKRTAQSFKATYPKGLVFALPDGN